MKKLQERLEASLHKISLKQKELRKQLNANCQGHTDSEVEDRKNKTLVAQLDEIYTAYPKIGASFKSIQATLGEIVNMDEKVTSFLQNSKLWQNTSRVALKITLPGQAPEESRLLIAKDLVGGKLKDKSMKTVAKALFTGRLNEPIPDTPSLFEIVDTFLHNELKKISFRENFFNDTLSEAKAEIKLAKRNHHILRKTAKKQFLFAAKNETAKILWEVINTIQAQNLNLPYQWINFKSKIEKIGALKSYDETNQAKEDEAQERNIDPSILETNKDCLIANRDVVQFAIDFKKYFENNNKINQDKKNELLELTQQLEETTKRWLDPHFKKPTKLTTTDKVRVGLKLATLLVAILAAITALALLATPLAPIAPFIGIVAIIGLAPILDTFCSALYCYARYKRNWLVTQKTEIITASVLAPVLIFVSNLASIFHAVTSIFNNFSTVLGKYAMHGMSLAGNSGSISGIFKNLLGLAKPRVRNNKDLENYSTISREEALRFILKTESSPARAVAPAPAPGKAPIPAPKPKTSLATHVDSLWGKHHEKPYVFVFKDSAGNVRTRGTHYQQFKDWLMEEKNKELSEINPLLQQYVRLPSASSLENRQNLIGNLIKTNQKYKNDNSRSSEQNSPLTVSVNKLLRLLESERKILGKILDYTPTESKNEKKQVYTFQDDEAKKDNKEGYLILSR